MAPKAVLFMWENITNTLQSPARKQDCSPLVYILGLKQQVYVVSLNGQVSVGIGGRRAHPGHPLCFEALYLVPHVQPFCPRMEKSGPWLKGEGVVWWCCPGQGPEARLEHRNGGEPRQSWTVEHAEAQLGSDGQQRFGLGNKPSS